MVIAIVLACSSCVAIGVVYYQMFISETPTGGGGGGGGVSSIIPASLFFKRKNGTKFLGHNIRTIHDTTENECLRACLDNPYCLGATYDTTKSRCNLQTHNHDTNPDFSADWNNTVNFSRVDPSPSVEESVGYESSVRNKTVTPATSLFECINKCAGKKDACLAANYYGNKNECVMLLDPTTTKLVPNANSVFFYKKGLPNSDCKNNLDCVFGLCKAGKCLASSPLEKGEGCALDADCASGICSSQDISYAAQEEERQKLLQKDDIDAIECDKYKNCRDCEEMLLPNGGYSGAKCQWRMSVPIEKLKEPQKCGGTETETSNGCPKGTICDPSTNTCKCTKESCPDGCCSIDKRQCLTVPLGGEAKCFPKKIRKTQSVCL